MSKSQSQIKAPLLIASLVNVALAGDIFTEPDVSGLLVFF